MENYQELNREAWNKRTKVHLESSFYDQEAFLKGASSLNPIELELLGDVRGKSILHLQCHFGQDSISLARLGAKVTGVDLSDQSIAEARKLSEQCHVDVHFIESDELELNGRLDGQFDVVFTSYGTIGWLPDLEKWAEVVASHLKPGGRLVMVDFHPVVWMMDSHFSKIQFSYFNREEIVLEEGTYIDGGDTMSTKTVSWNHDFGELFGSLLGKGLRIQHFSEHDHSPYPCFNDVAEAEQGKFQIKDLEGKLPLSYAIEAHKDK